MPATPALPASERYWLDRADLQRLVDLLAGDGRRVLGPRVRDGAVVYAELDDVSALPRGVHSEQGPGHYRLLQGDGPHCFGWAAPAQSLKPVLFPPRETLWRARRDGDGRLAFEAVEPGGAPLAVLGARACDLAGVGLQDRHFLEHGPADPAYATRRSGLLVVAVDCGHSAATCFCASTGDGPAAAAGYDLALSETDAGYVVRVGSAAGEALRAALELRPASVAEQDLAAQSLDAAARAQVRRLPPGERAGAVESVLDDPRWRALGERCLACGNCTAVCPTCFCHRQVEAAELDGSASARRREWGSCFAADHGYIAGITLRQERWQRYRQWFGHKLGFWETQYGRGGCVGCGRCITWCPVGIDLTAEAEALLAQAPA